MDINMIANRMLAILACTEASLPAEQMSDMRELVEAGEPGIALENLCTQLCEYNVVVSASYRHEVAAIGRAMGLAESTWQKLAEGDL